MSVVSCFRNTAPQSLAEVMERFKRPELPPDAFDADIEFMTTFTDFGDAKDLGAEGQCVITLTGATAAGNTVVANVLDFLPYFYFKIEDPVSFARNCCDGWVNNTTPEVTRSVAEAKMRLNKAMNDRGLARSRNPVRQIVLEMKTTIWKFQFGPSLFAKVVLDHPGNITSARDVIMSGDVFGDRNTNVYECNVPFGLRLMIDKDIPGMGWLRLPRGTYQRVENPATVSQIEVTIKAEDIEALPDRKEFAPLRVLYWDTEQLAERGFPNPHCSEHLMILHGMVLCETLPSGKEKFITRIGLGIGTPERVENCFFIRVENEYQLMIAFAKWFNFLDPDIYGGYNSMNHDMRWHMKRAGTLRMDLFDAYAGSSTQLCRRIGLESTLEVNEIESGALGKQRCMIMKSFRIHHDLSISVRRDVALPLRDYRLDSVAKKTVGEQKNPVAYTDIPRLFHGTPEEQSMLWKYCIQDAELCYWINQKKNYTANYAEIGRACRTPMMWLFTRGQQIRLQGLFLNYMRKDPHQYVMPFYQPPARQPGRKTEKEYEGAAVLDPAIGMTTVEEDGGTSTLDFAALYPSIMISHNLCYTTCVEPERVEEVRARGIPVRQGPSPKSDGSIPGHYFVYPWRDCSAEEAAEKKAEGRNVRQIVENSYLRRNMPGANNALPAVGQWQWEDPALIGLLPRIEMNLLANRGLAKKDMGAAQMKTKILNHVIGLDGLLNHDSKKELPFLYQRRDKLETMREKHMDDIIRAIAEEFMGKGKTAKRAESGESYRDMLTGYYKEMLQKFNEAFGEEGTVELTRQNVDWFMSNIEFWEGEAAANDGRQMALKVICNSVYGFTGATVGKLPMLEVSSTVTAYGRDMIMFAKATVEHRDPETGLYAHVDCPYETDVLYGDTDSIMVHIRGCHDIRETNNWGRKFSKFISALYQHYKVSLEWEKSFFMFLLMSKKRYIAYQVGENKNGDLEYKLNCKGIETTRRDNPDCMRDETEEIIKLIFFKRDIPAAVERLWLFIRRVLMRDFTLDQFAESRFVSKGSEDYKTVPGFVELKEREEARNPGLKITGRFYFVHVYKKQPRARKGVKNRKVIAIETPEYLRANPQCGLYINTDEYIRKIRPVMERLFANIIVQDGTSNRHYPTYEQAVAAYSARQKIAGKILFEGDHMNIVKMPEVNTSFFGQSSAAMLKEDDFYAFDDHFDMDNFVASASPELRATAEWNEWHEHRQEHGAWPEAKTLFSRPTAEMMVTPEFRRFCQFGTMKVDGKTVFGPPPPIHIKRPVKRFQATALRFSRQQKLVFPEAEIDYHDEDEENFEHDYEED